MEIYAKGQLSYMILNCLLERDFYGLDIITEIRDKSSGRIQLKKPSVYSNLTRMEKQNLVSSYMQSSDLGPNRRYYSITEKGRTTYSSLKNDFDRSGIDVFKDFVVDNDEAEAKQEIIKADKDEMNSLIQSGETINVGLEKVEKIESIQTEDSDYFDFSAQNTPAQNEIKSQEKTDGVFLQKESDEIIKEEQESLEILENIIEEKQNMLAQELQQNDVKGVKEIEEAAKHDASLNEAQDYNKRLYDISKEIKHVMKKRSFAEDQISIAVDENAVLERSNEKTRQSIQEIKTSLLASKGIVGNERLSEDAFYKNRPFASSMLPNSQDKNEEISDNTQTEKINDDGIFITERAVVKEVQKPKKIEPPRLKVYTETKINTLPAPKRDVNIDPSHKEIISRLYAKSKDSSVDVETAQSTGGLFDYADLQDFYKANSINFKPYEKSLPRVKHNTNLLYFYLSLIVFGLCAMFSGGLYAILVSFKMTNINTDFLFILLPALVLIMSLTRFYMYKTQSSWQPKPMLTQTFMWMLTILFALCIVGINLICGLASTEFALFATSLILPIVTLTVLMPIRYYMKRSMLVRFYK